MTVTELNNYIEHYLKEDKTHTAIMLTGEWGSGKTYYIENKLVPFLQNSQKNRCVVISLYGVENISEISKSIYMELRMKALAKNSEIIETGKFMAKTIVKGVAGIFGFDANMSDDDLQNLYSSVDLSGKLLILEDLERSHIEITKLLGYINNLVERDGVKVLVVANENEILNKPLETFDFTKLFSSDLKNNDEEDTKNSIADNNEQVQKYLRIKEKTISDTIYFESDYCEAIKNIIAIFNNEKLQKIMSEKKDIIDELASMVEGYCHKNFRTFIFATQKTVDIFDKMEENYENDFLKSIYFGIICFSSRIKADEFPEWEGTEYLSTLLGTNWHPLFRFCYDYIRWQKIDREKINKARDAYNKMKLYNKNADQDDTDLQKLYSYFVRTESEVKDILKSIENRLKDPEDIGYYSYGKLAVYLVTISHAIGFDYAQCKEYMIKNIRGKGKDIDSDLLFLPMYDFLEQGEKNELENFIEQLSESMNFRNNQSDFSYNQNDIKHLHDSVLKEEYKIKDSHQFISRYNVSQLVEMLFHASSKQIEDFRDILFVIYRHASKADFIESDRSTMKEILDLVQEKIVSNDYQAYGIDGIQQRQLHWLCNNLNTFISQMS